MLLWILSLKRCWPWHWQKSQTQATQNCMCAHANVHGASCLKIQLRVQPMTNQLQENRHEWRCSSRFRMHLASFFTSSSLSRLQMSRDADGMSLFRGKTVHYAHIRSHIVDVLTELRLPVNSLSQQVCCRCVRVRVCMCYIHIHAPPKPTSQLGSVTKPLEYRSSPFS